MWRFIKSLLLHFRPDPHNRGLIIVEPKPTDFIAGKFTAITYQELNPSADWRPYLPTDERQFLSYQAATYGPGYTALETMACVSFSANNVLETLLNFYLTKHLLPVQHENFLKDNGYIDSNGKVNFSDRYLAKLSGTTSRGNDMGTVAETIRHCGAVPESLWPWDIKITNTWSQYYAAIPQSVKDMGKKFTELFDIQYEYVYSNPEQHLKQSPLQITVSTSCSGYMQAKGMIPACGGAVNHAVTWSYGKYEIYDHYDPFKKWLSQYYYVPYKMKFVINFKTMNETVITLNYKGKYGLIFIGGLSGGVVFASTWDHWLELCRIYGKDPNVLELTVS